MHSARAAHAGAWQGGHAPEGHEATSHPQVILSGRLSQHSLLQPSREPASSAQHSMSGHATLVAESGTDTHWRQ